MIPSDRTDRWPAVGVFIVVLLVFARLLFCDFTWWDDPETIHHNPLLNPPTWAAIAHYWAAAGPHAPMGLYVPVTYTAWALLAFVSRTAPTVDDIRLNPVVFHGANVLLHAASAVLVYVLLRRLSAGRLPAALGAMLFAVHPAQVETVAWASGTKDLLGGFFTLVALDRYVQSARANGRIRTANLAAATAAVLLGMLSKPTAIVAPLLMLAVGRLALNRSWRQLGTELWPMFVLMIPCAIWTRWSQPSTFSSPLPVATRPLVAADALAFYAGKLLWPMHLSPDYGRSPSRLLQTGQLYYTWVIPLLLLAGCEIARRRGRRAPMLALLLLVIPLLPVSGLEPFLYQYHSTVTDHYLYLPMLGVAVAAAGACANRISTTAVLLVAAILAARTIAREPAWQNTRTLFADAVRTDPSTFGNWDLLGFSYALDASRAGHSGDDSAAGRSAAIAAECYTTAIALNPLDVPARDNLARIDVRRGNREAAVEQVREIIRLQPQLPADLRANPADLAARLREYGNVR